MKNFDICIQSILPIKFDPLKTELPVRNPRFVYTPTESIYSQNHLTSSANFQENVERFIRLYNNSNNKHSLNIINIYKNKKDMLLWLNNGYVEDTVKDISRVVENSKYTINVSHYNYKGFYILKDLIVKLSQETSFPYFIFHNMNWKDITNFYYKNNFKLVNSTANYRKKDHLVNHVHYKLIYFLVHWYGQTNVYNDLLSNFKDYTVEDENNNV